MLTADACATKQWRERKAAPRCVHSEVHEESLERLGAVHPRHTRRRTLRLGSSTLPCAGVSIENLNHLPATQPPNDGHQSAQGT